jgi:hypothetical protein
MKQIEPLTITYFKKLILLLSILILSSCFKTPYSLKVHKINEDNPQQMAVITLSDPQIYQRETLINDRLSEAKLINKLLIESEQIGLEKDTKDFRDEFTDQIVRDIETYQAFSLGLDANFNSNDKRSAIHDQELVELTHQIAITEKRLELEELIANRTGSELAKSGDDGESDSDGDGNGDSNGNEGEDGNAGSGGVDNPTTNYQKIFDKNSALLTTMRGNELTPISKKIKATPQDRFRDLQAYRAELRQELAALNLDDLHDHDSNAIYRMQFRATVMPGEHKDKYGITRLTVHPPKLKDEDMKEIYYAWLNHITYRMNTWNKSNNSIDWQIQYSALESAGLFGVIAIKLSSESTVENCIPDIIKTDSQSSRTYDFDNKCILIAFPTQYLESESNTKYFLRESSYIGDSNEIGLAKLKIIYDELNNKRINKIPINNADFYLAQYLLSVIKQISAKANLGREINTHLRKAALRIGQIGTYYAQQTPPDVFKKIIRILPDKNNTVAYGYARVYAANPMEYSQRLSTTAKSANSMEMALAMSAGLDTKGIDSKLGIGYLKNSAANIAALERVPLVVGFSERLEGKNKLHDLSAAGWVFGPKARLNAKKKDLELIHSVSAYDVSADFSIPGWWPHVKIKKETAWVGNWFNTDESIRMDSSDSKNEHSTYFFDVSLPLNRTDLDGLTNLIAKKTIGSFAELLVINDVKPEVISACSKEVTFLIKGVNIWRGTEVFMSGLRAEKITILPDMEGIAAKFDLDKFYETNNNINQLIGGSQKLQLTLWTRNGSDSINVTIQGSRKVIGNSSTCTANSFVSEVYDTGLTRIVDIVPHQINLCKNEDINFLVKLNYELRPDILNFNSRFQLNGVQSKSSTSLNSDNRIFNVTFDKSILNTVKANSSIALSIVDDYDFNSVGINVVSCKTKKPLPAITLANIDSPIIGKISNGAILLETKIKHISGAFAKRTIKFGLRTDDMIATNKKWIPSLTSPQATVKDVKIFNTKFKIDANNTHIGSFTSGRKIKLALLIYAEDSDTKIEKVIDIPGFVIFYKNGEELISLEPDNFSTIPAQDIKLGLPINANLAYSGITGSKIKAEFADTTLKTFKLTVTPDNALDTGSKILIDLEDGSKRANYLVEKKKIGTDINIILTLSNTVNKNIPKVKMLKIKK